jgi:hypothetical protein
MSDTNFSKIGLWISVLLISVHLGGTGLWSAETTSDLVWKPETKSVAVFKNGLAFFTQEAKARLNEGWCYGRETPPAAFGTLAIYSTDPKHVVDIVGAGTGEVVDFERTSDKYEPTEKRRRLEKFVGLNAKIEYRQESGKLNTEGKIVGFSDEYIIIRSGSQSIAISTSTVTRFQLADSPLRIHVSDDAGKSPVESVVAMSYLSSGILWIPEYTLKILDDETAELTLRGTLVNEAEDLVDCRFHFVVGVPHFVHSDLKSPLAVGRTLRTIGSGLTTLSGSNTSQAVMSQMLNRAAIVTNGNSVNVNASPVATADASGSTPENREQALMNVLGNLPRMEASGAGDFTVYTKDNLTVRQGERAMVTLMTQRIRYGHRYRWEDGQPIKHFLTLQNRSSNAWTTGPCLALSQTQALSEDMLKYTPKGAVGEFQVTNAINVACDSTEEESDRDLKAHTPNPSEYFDRVTVDGSVTLKSFEKKPVEVVVGRPIQGKPLQADEGGKLRTDPTKLRLLERSGSIQWTLTLQPGETKTLTYRYERFVPSK